VVVDRVRLLVEFDGFEVRKRPTPVFDDFDVEFTFLVDAPPEAVARFQPRLFRTLAGTVTE